jgi:PAS domain S-box-containing protein
MKLTSKVILIIVSSVTVITSLIFYGMLLRFEAQSEQHLLTTARSVYKNILITRQWISDHNGVYVDLKEGESPNEFLPNALLLSRSGDSLTLKNPALVTRELSELSQGMGSNFSFHMASLNYLNPVNQPDDFEFTALNMFHDSLETNIHRREYYRIEKAGEHTYFRYFAPLFTRESCLSCHSAQGYQLGDLRGGLSVILNIDDHQQAKQDNVLFLILSAIFTIGILSFIIFIALQVTVIRPLKNIEQATQKIQQDDYEFRLEIQQKDEIGHLASAFEEMRMKIKDYTGQLKLSEEKYRTLIENSLEAIAIIDEEKNILEANNKLFKLTGYNNRTIKGINLHQLIDISRIRKIKIPGADLEDSEHFETFLFTADGIKIPAEIYLLKGFSLADLDHLSFVYVRDLSERKKLEHFSIQTEKMVSLGQISSGIAHELRNPLFSLNNNLDYLYTKLNIHQEFQNVYPELKDSIGRIHQIISAILDYARPHKPEYRTVNVTETIDKCILLVKKQFENAATQIVTDFEEKSQVVEADPHSLEQVFMNLFLNAYDAMEQAGTLTIRTRSMPEALHIEVKDTGKGIAESDIDRIFDPFYTKSQNGTGLGLAIVQRILSQHNATCWVESNLYLGTTFYMEIPWHQKGTE